jgi:hypothetical protein
MVQDGTPNPELKPALPEETFQILNPFGGENYVIGSHVAIYWTGGNAGSEKVNIQLIDVPLWRVCNTVTLAADTTGPLRAFHWIIPDDPTDIDPTHDFQIYVENVARTNWHYSDPFKITALANIQLRNAAS